jgi:HD-GYP domain-containing protein (c-di-GMP phosphodiesterase class II)
MKFTTMTDPTASHEASDLPLQVRRADLLAAVARVLDYRPTREVPHHGRVAALAAHVAARLGGTDPREVFFAGLVHDIGLLSEQWDLSHPPNLEEQANRPLTRSHPLVGAQMLAEVPRLLSVAEVVLDHHEWVDGHGYPRGKSGEEVPWASQVLRLADTCDFLLREQGAPELLALLDAVRTRAARQVTDDILEAGTDVLDRPGFYAQLLAGDDVDLLVRTTTHHLAEDDFVASGMEMTALLELLATLADAHASDHIGHSRRVANLTVMVAMAMGLSAEETAKAKWAALVHDLGMVAVPKTLLDEPRLLSEKELRDVRSRSARVGTFLGSVEGLEEVTHIAACHREAFDGSGCPDGLAGSAIPLGARLISLCDTFDALTSPRPYREARDTSLAIDILIRGSGGMFDPDVVSAAVPVFLISDPSGTERQPAMS